MDYKELEKIIEDIPFEKIPIFNRKKFSRSTFHNGVISLLFQKGIDLGYSPFFERPIQISKKYKGKNGNYVPNKKRIDIVWIGNIKKYKHGIDGEDIVQFEVDTTNKSRRNSIKKFVSENIKCLKVSISYNGFRTSKNKKPVFTIKDGIMFVLFSKDDKSCL